MRTGRIDVRLKAESKPILSALAKRMGCTWGPAGNIGLLLDYIANELREGRDVTFKAKDHGPTATRPD